MRFLILFVTICLAWGCTETGNQRKDKVGETVVGQSMARSKDAVCMNNLRQIRDAVEIAKTSGADDADALPKTLAEVRGLGNDMKQCPIGKEPYEYDPATGKVHCPHPGHEKY